MITVMQGYYIRRKTGINDFINDYNLSRLGHLQSFNMSRIGHL
jgi:hypothetical protein